MQNDNDLMMRLAKLRDSIKKKENEVDNIRKLGMLKAGVNRDYVHNLRAELLSCQREYNFILDQNPALAAGGKIIIDTFKDHWLGKSEYRILEPVEVNIEKRLQESDWQRLRFCLCFVQLLFMRWKKSRDLQDWPLAKSKPSSERCLAFLRFSLRNLAFPLRARCSMRGMRRR